MQHANSLKKISIKLKRVPETKSKQKLFKDNHEKQELNMTAARKSKEHSTKISMKTMSILGKKRSVFLSQTRYARVQLVMTANKSKTN